jgi:hypothetical protein
MVKGNLHGRQFTGRGKVERFDKVLTLDEPLRVDITSMFVQHGKDTVKTDEFTFMHTQGRVCSPEEIAFRAAELMRDCAASGLNLTIENKPKWSFATGNYYPHILIRQSRKIISKILTEFAEAQKRKRQQEQAAREAQLDKVVPSK